MTMNILRLIIIITWPLRTCVCAFGSFGKKLTAAVDIIIIDDNVTTLPTLDPQNIM
jgi:hypothetical protein